MFKGYNGGSWSSRSRNLHGTSSTTKKKGADTSIFQNAATTLQEKFNELEDIGVMKRQEDIIGVTEKYINPSFLIKKSTGGFRLVTAFADVSRYSKPQP